VATVHSEQLPGCHVIPCNCEMCIDLDRFWNGRRLESASLECFRYLFLLNLPSNIFFNETSLINLYNLATRMRMERGDSQSGQNLISCNLYAINHPTAHPTNYHFNQLDTCSKTFPNTKPNIIINDPTKK